MIPNIGYKKITKILCNRICVLALSDGKLYSWGDDTENKSGLLGLGNIYYQSSPIMNPNLINYHLTNISLSNKHACAFDQINNLLFTWGTGEYGELGQGSVKKSMTPNMVNY